MSNWGEPIPERPASWSVVDLAWIILGLVVITAIGIIAAGGPS